MDEITDNVGGLSLNAKEWKPGQGFAPTPKGASAFSPARKVNTSRQISAGSAESGGAGGGGGWNNAAAAPGQSSWGGKI